MSKKIFLSFLTLTFLVAGVFLFGSTAKAQGTVKTPEENTLCWTKKSCEDERTKQKWPNPKEGFIEDETDCPGFAGGTDDPNYKWGKCLPGALTKAQVSFGGNATFANIGDYIKAIYNYALIILAILSSIMIIVSGIQYISSAGSQEAITNAKKRIIGALIGLALAYMSYTILNMINPSTVNLRLPGVYLIREMPMVNWCNQLKIDQNIIFTQTKDSMDIFGDKTAGVSNFADKTSCGKEYGYGLGKCIGVNCNGYEVYETDGQPVECGTNKECTCVAGGSHKSGYMCRAGVFGGNILAQKEGPYSEYVYLISVCEKAGIKFIDNYSSTWISSANTDSNSKNYIFPFERTKITDNKLCINYGEGVSFSGFLVATEVDEGAIGQNDFYLLSQKDCGTNLSTANFSAGSSVDFKSVFDAWSRKQRISAGLLENNEQNIASTEESKNSNDFQKINNAVNNLILYTPNTILRCDVVIPSSLPEL